MKKGKEAINEIIAPEDKVIVSVDLSKIDKLSFDIRNVRMGQVISGLNDKFRGYIAHFGPHFAEVVEASDSKYKYLSMAKENVYAFQENK